MTDNAGSKPAPGAAAHDRKHGARMILIGAVAVLLVWFAVDNHQSVPIHFWVHTAQAPVFLVIIITAALSAGATWFLLRRRNQQPKHQG